MKAKFHPIDMETWPRAETYNYFTKVVKPVTYTINVTMDVTILRNTLKSKDIKFFPAYLYLVTRAIGKQQEFRLAFKDGILGYWDTLTPLYPVFHEDDKTISFLWTEYDDEFEIFYKNYITDITLHKNSHGIMSSKGAPPSNNYIIACVPWFTFNSLCMHLQDTEKYYAPMFETGGFAEKDGRIMMPLSITANHATADGYHIKVLLEELQRTIDHPEEWM